MATNVGVYQIAVSRSDAGDPPKIYIGHSSDLRRRKRVHFARLRKGIHHNIPMQKAWEKYGEAAFSFVVLEICSADLLAVIEQKYLDAARVAHGDERILNIMKDCVTSQLGVKRTDEMRAKMRDSRLSNWRDPAYREDTLRGCIEAQNRPGARALNSARQREAQNRPEVKQKQIAAQKIAQNRPDVKARKSASVRAALALPESIINRSITNSRPEVKARRSAAAIAWRIKRAQVGGA